MTSHDCIKPSWVYGVSDVTNGVVEVSTTWQRIFFVSSDTAVMQVRVELNESLRYRHGPLMVALCADTKLNAFLQSLACSLHNCVYKL